MTLFIAPETPCTEIYMSYQALIEHSIVSTLKGGWASWIQLLKQADYADGDVFERALSNLLRDGKVVVVGHTLEGRDIFSLKGREIL